ncbi:hypothetical protein IFM89_010176 [Coptis chinensis]|uniref:Cytochrome P450 n=1 Tax=Coptis chinensis TaxID=261450 RepID=A0A835M4K5_9MAGN|nr:hypothetical protein IFM89_010176 [Coptis chinensis]
MVFDKDFMWAMLTKHYRYRRKEDMAQLPPGPKGFPVVAREMFKNHDIVLAGRKFYEAMTGKHGNEGSLITSQYGPHWRMLRRLCTTEFFVKSRLDSMKVFVDGVSIAWCNRKRRLVKVVQMLLTSANFLPMLRWLDPQGIQKKTQFHVDQAFDIIGAFIKERMELEVNKKGEEKKKYFLNVLLEFRGNGVEEPAMFNVRTINAIVLEMFTAGTYTTTSTLEWVMAELLHNPKDMKNVQDELRKVIDSHDQELEEKDLENLPYLIGVIKETLRLHPPLPFLVPHMAMNSCNMLGVGEIVL